MILEKKFYKITTVIVENGVIFEVERRYSDFEWLSIEIKKKYPGIIIAGLPEKNP